MDLSTRDEVQPKVQNPARMGVRACAQAEPRPANPAGQAGGSRGHRHGRPQLRRGRVSSSSAGRRPGWPCTLCHQGPHGWRLLPCRWPGMFGNDGATQDFPT